MIQVSNLRLILRRQGVARYDLRGIAPASLHSFEVDVGERRLVDRSKRVLEVPLGEHEVLGRIGADRESSVQLIIHRSFPVSKLPPVGRSAAVEGKTMAGPAARTIRE